MLIGSLQASAEQQSLTIRKNNGFTMKEATLLTRGRISMHCRSLEVSCRPWERSVVGNAFCPFKRAAPLIELILPPEKEKWGDRDRSGWVGSGGPYRRPGPWDILQAGRKRPLPAWCTWPVNCEMGLIRAVHIQACAKVLCRHSAITSGPTLLLLAAAKKGQRLCLC